MIIERLEQLRAERERGVTQLELLDRRRSELRDTLLRIAGAIEVLEELAATPNGQAVSDDSGTDSELAAPVA